MLGYPYGANKAALNHLTKMIATQFAEKGIRANAILPGFFRTEATEVGPLYSLLLVRLSTDMWG